MDLLSLAIHALNFLAPAIGVAVWITFIHPLIWRQSKPWHGWRRQIVFNSSAGALMLLLGFLYFGQDGKMLSYAAMVLACASSQWLLTREKHA